MLEYCDDIALEVKQRKATRTIAFDQISLEKLAEAFGVPLCKAEQAQARLGHMYRQRA